ncbi:L-seryl-tRNA(Sec) selenium transferase [Planococcus faecalis]|uniref:L-seryl-tRNA(Sec) selenium transferase n=1 Tax=Planococcus faecalis TaxID=1598147 RepID=A0ABM6IPR3_9BACL|nr:L-seryl-tRNA(Sec) selenium transferase [Planococcus faecalis]AQU78576.1 L-seryl-tRNA(Sec) selenium transferase [Planococcus faecalis]OHX53236.1 L-seryl-tRNA(Sec) selenium transferase [Planococcus faecalis]
MKQYLRLLPAVHELQKDPRFETLKKKFDLHETQLTEFLQQEVGSLRKSLLAEETLIEKATPDFTGQIFKSAELHIQIWQEDRLERVINGTGTVLHTNLGRSRLSDAAIAHVVRTAENYSNLEYQLVAGKRGSRHQIIEDLVVQATGAEAAMVVNNNAAAVFLILSALAKKQEVIVSRGQLVEIGGSFRVSSIMEESGARLVEVGTTNKTHLVDYEQAITEETAMMMKVHTSNFKMIGFTETVETAKLVELTGKHQHVIFYEDLGSGALYDFKQHGIGDEPLVREVIESGVDLVSFSGDKLLGGPQAGLIAGKKELVERLKKHQLARVLRVDKMTLAAMEETLKSYLARSEKIAELPTIRDIIRPAEDIKVQAQLFIRNLQSKSSNYHSELQESTSQIGGGTMPGVEIPTYIAAITHKRLSAAQLSLCLRKVKPAIVSRIQEDRVCIDFRTINFSELDDLLAGFIACQ